MGSIRTQRSMPTVPNRPNQHRGTPLSLRRDCAVAAKLKSSDFSHTDARRRLGSAIRLHRQELGMTLQELASKADISVSLISQVERGIVDPSLSSLRQIAAGLNSTAFKLLEAEDPAIHHVVKGTGLRLDLPDTEVVWELLSPSSLGSLQVAVAELVPMGSTTREALAHEGDEFMLVLSGTVTLELDAESIVLNEGDAITFNTRLPHRVVSVSDTPTRVLVVLTRRIL